MRHLGWCLVLVGCTKSPDDVPEAPWPEWTFHHWVWEDESTQESALALVDGYLARGIPVGAIIIDSPWATGYSTFEWDRDRFPDPKGMVDAFHDRGVRVLLWTVPGINVDVQPLYDEAAEAGYFMQRTAGSGPGVVSWWKGEGSLLDYFNPEAVAWWHGLLDRTFAETDIDGWKTDGLDFSAHLTPYSPGAGAEVARLDYSHAYYRDFHDYTRSVLGEDRILSARPIDNYGYDIGGDVAAFAPVDIAWGSWVGDQDPTFEGLAAALDNFWYSADYGYVSFGSDIGGYRVDDAYPQGRSKELFLRWAWLGAVSPVMENGGAGLHHPWAWDDETVAIYADAVDLHMALVPYLMREGAIAFDEGRSLLTFLGKDGDYRYLLGPDVFVAPILAEGGARRVVFPDEGRWIDVFDPTAVHGPGTAVDVALGLDAYPIYVREGSDVAAVLTAWGAAR